jgi:molecular chaperone GrpE
MEEEKKEQNIKTEDTDPVETEDMIEEDVIEEETVKEEEEEEEVVVEEDLDQLKKKIYELEAEKEKYHDQLLRLQADFINYRKRVNRDQQKVNLMTKASLLEGFLPVVDNFERALTAAEIEDDFKKGVEMIYRQLKSFLEAQGVGVIPTVGEHFDHNLHDAMLQVEDEEYETGIIIEELQKGYILEGKVIRPAMVKVAQ